MIYYEIIANVDTIKEYENIPGSNEWLNVINETAYTVSIYNNQEESIYNKIITVASYRSISLPIPASRIERYLKIHATGGTIAEKIVVILSPFKLGS